jgi:subtilisin family serine protease
VQEYGEASMRINRSTCGEFLALVAIIALVAVIAIPNLSRQSRGATASPALCVAGEYLISRASVPQVDQKKLKTLDSLGTKEYALVSESSSVMVVRDTEEVVDERYLNKDSPSSLDGRRLVPETESSLCGDIRKQQRELRRENLLRIADQEPPRPVRRIECSCNSVVQVTQSFPTDTSFTSQWSLQAGQDLYGAQAPQAWDITTGEKSVVIAVIDTGVDYQHPDLASNMWVNPGEVAGDKIDNDGNGIVDDVNGKNTITDSGNPMDDHGHGTHVAGIIGAVGGNNEGITGVMWKTSLLALKAFDASGEAPMADIIDAVDYMTALKKRGVNIVAANYSFGQRSYSQGLYDAMKRASDAGVAQVAAAGNETTNNDLYPSYPSNFTIPGLISVAATDRGALATYSNYGAKTVHIGAPGSNIYSTIPVAFGSYAFLDGTSMAAPHVAGALGLLHSVASPLAPATAVNAVVSQGYQYSTSPLIGKTTSGRGLHLRNAVLSVAPAQRIVRGCITSATSQPMAGIQVTLSDGTRVKSKPTGFDGCFSMLASAGQYTLTPSKFAYSFSPANYQVTVGSADISGRNFSGAEAPVFTVQGRIVSPTAGTNLSGVTLTVSQGTTQLFTQTSTAQGTYSFTKSLPAGSYTLRAIRGIDVLTPSLQSFTVAGDMNLADISLNQIKPEIITQPARAHVGEGQSAVFTVVGVGANLRYQWYDSTSLLPISGATSNTLTIPNVILTANGKGYFCKVYNDQGQALSQVAHIFVIPIITTQPSDVIAVKGQIATFSYVAPGINSSKWYLDGAFVIGCYGTSCIIYTDQLALGSHTVRVDVTNSANHTVSSRTATLNMVSELPPNLLLSPSPANAMVGGYITFTAYVMGTSPKFVWKKNGTVIPNQSSNTLTLTDLKLTDSGITISVDVTTAGGTATTSTVLTVNNWPPFISLLSPNLPTFKVGQTPSFTVSASGDSLSYQWYHKGALVSGATGPSLSLPALKLSDSGSSVRVVVSNVAGSTERSTSYTVQQTVLPSISTQPQNVTVDEGSSPTFSVVSNGSQFIWYRNGVAIPHGLSSSLGVPFVSMADDGARFSVDVITADGKLRSQEATLSVRRIPLTITKPIESITVKSGDYPLFSVETTRSDQRYEWSKNGVVIPDVQTPYLTFRATQADDGAKIRVVVTDGSGASVSSEATLRVTAVAQPVNYITFWSSSSYAREGEIVTFHGSMNSTPSKLQVLRNGVVIYEGVLPYIKTVDASDGGAYIARAWSGSSYVDSSPVTLTLLKVGLSVSKLPASIKTKVGRVITLKASASTSDGSAISYQWYRGETPIPRANKSLLKYKVSAKDKGAKISFRAMVGTTSVQSRPTELIVTK